MTRAGLVAGVHGVEYVGGALWRASKVEKEEVRERRGTTALRGGKRRVALGLALGHDI